MQNKSNKELVELLKDPDLKHAAGEQLMKQSPSNSELKELIHLGVQKAAAWPLLKSQGTKEDFNGMYFWFDWKEELEDALLRFDWEFKDLKLMLIHGCGERTWQRLLQMNPDRSTLVTLLELSPSRDIVADYLLSGPDDSGVLAMIAGYTSRNQEAWERLKKCEPTPSELRTAMHSDELKYEAWYFYLTLPMDNFDIRLIIEHDDTLRDIAAHELFERDPTKEDLLCIIGFSVHWKKAWSMLLANDPENLDFSSLIHDTPFKDHAWEHLKTQSPTNRELRSAINIDDYEHEALWNEIARFILTRSPSNDDLGFIIRFFSALQDEAVAMLLKQSPGKSDMELIKRFRA